MPLWGNATGGRVISRFVKITVFISDETTVSKYIVKGLEVSCGCEGILCAGTSVEEVETCFAMMSWEEASVTPLIEDSDQQLKLKIHSQNIQYKINDFNDSIYQFCSKISLSLRRLLKMLHVSNA